MRTRFWVVTLLAAALVLGSVTAALGTSASFDSGLIAGGGIIDVFDQQAQDLCGRYLVYESRNTLNPASKFKLYSYDRYTGETTAVAGTAGNQTNADVWNGLVVYQDDSNGTKDLRIADLRTRSDAAYVVGNPYDLTGPKIQDNVAVWHSGPDVVFHNRSLGQSGIVPAGTGSQGDVGTSRGFIYYQDDDALPNIYRYDRAWDDTECISGNLTGNGNWAGDLAVHDDTVVWRANRFAWPNTAIRTYDVRSGIETTLASNAFEREQPDVFGRASAWVDPTGTGIDGVVAKVEGWSSGSVYATTTVMGDPSVYGNSVAFGPGYDVWLAEHPTTVVRVAGMNRYATAAETSKRHFAASGIVVLASGESWADALSASGLAGAVDCPLLLVRKDSIPDETYQEIVRLGASHFFIVGGTAAVSQGIEDSIALDLGTVQRIAGSTRYGTAAAVALDVADYTGMEPFYSTFSYQALFVNGESYADALAAAPIAAKRHMPILLVRDTSLPAETATSIGLLPIRGGVVVGGTAAVSAGTKTAIDTAVVANPGGSATARWAGANRYDTARVVAHNAVSARWLDLDALGMASGQSYADALAAGAALGSYGSPVVLTRPSSLPPETQAFLDAWPYEIGELQVFGGTGAVSEAVKNAADARLYP